MIIKICQLGFVLLLVSSCMSKAPVSWKSVSTSCNSSACKLELAGASGEKNYAQMAANYQNNMLSNKVNKGVEYIEPIHINISAKGVNHLSFAPMVVTEITGDISEYSAFVSESGMDCFLTSKLEAGNDIPIFVTLAGGRVINLHLHVDKYKLPKIAKIDLRDSNFKNHIRSEIDQMINHMQRGAVGKYYVQTIKGSKASKKDNNKNEQHIIIDEAELVMKKTKEYRFDNLIGIELRLEHLDKTKKKVGCKSEIMPLIYENINLDKYLFKKLFINLVAVSVSKPSLERGEVSTVYVVLQNKDWVSL